MSYGHPAAFSHRVKKIVSEEVSSLLCALVHYLKQALYYTISLLAAWVVQSFSNCIIELLLKLLFIQIYVFTIVNKFNFML